MSRMTPIIHITLIVAVIAFGQTAKAQNCSDAAKDAFNKATKHYSLGEYEQSAALFEQAYDQCPTSYGTLYNLAQSHRFLGRYDTAITYFRSWLTMARTDAKVPKKLIDETEQIVSELAGLLAAQKQSNEKPPQGLDGRSPPGGQPGRSDVAPWYRDWVGWTLVGVGVVGAAAGSWMLIHAGDLDDQAADAPTEGERIDLSESADNYRLSGGILLAVGGVSLAVGVVKLFIHDTGHESAPASSRIQASCGFGWCVLRGRF